MHILSNQSNSVTWKIFNLKISIVGILKTFTTNLKIKKQNNQNKQTILLFSTLIIQTNDLYNPNTKIIH